MCRLRLRGRNHLSTLATVQIKARKINGFQSSFHHIVAARDQETKMSLGLPPQSWKPTPQPQPGEILAREGPGTRQRPLRATVRRRGAPVPPPPPSTCGAHLAFSPADSPRASLPASSRCSGPGLPLAEDFVPPRAARPARARPEDPPHERPSVLLIGPGGCQLERRAPSRRRGPGVGARPVLAVVSGSAGLAGGRAVGSGGGGDGGGA